MACAVWRWTFPGPILPESRAPTARSRSRPIGTEDAFDADALAARYGDADGYHKQFEARLDELVAEGWLLPDDVAYIRDDFAKVSDF